MYAQQRYDVSERRACRALDINRDSVRYRLRKGHDEEALREDILRLALKYGRYGYRRITALLRAEGWHVNHKRVERIWREEGLSMIEN
ncbi:MAG TPA: transposase [Micavibrio sp.]|nr:transposase [Micavibrio sp.]